MEKSLDELGVEYSFYIKEYLVIDNKLISFKYSIIMSYEDMSPGVCSVEKTYKFNSEIHYESELTLSKMIKYVEEEEFCDGIEKTSIFKDAYQDLVTNSKTKVLRCGGPNWSIVRTL